jgi:hypothetical protein
MSWARRRQALYLTFALTFVAVVAVVVFLAFRQEPSCFDGLQNQDEIGIDCGGACQAVCAEEAKGLVVAWARPLLLAPGVYDLVGIVDNHNSNLAARRLPYTFRVVDSDNLLILTKSGEVTIDPAGRSIVFVSGIVTGQRIAHRVFLELGRNPEWVRREFQKPDLAVTGKEFTPDPVPIVTAQITNRGLTEVSSLEVFVVLQNGEENAFAASRSRIDFLPVGASKRVIFTWPRPFTEEPAFIDVHWRLTSDND